MDKTYTKTDIYAHEWIILENLFFGYEKNINFTGIKKIYIFDLDNTIIKTKSGKVFPINVLDWELLHPNVKMINDLYQKNYIIGIVSNQKGIKNRDQIKDFIFKLTEIKKIINFHFAFVSIKDDNYRKPLPSSWEYIKTNLLQNVDTNNLIKKNKIYFVGDAFGRENDFSDTDIKYALNCGFNFKPPEVMFNINGGSDNEYNISGNIKYPDILYFDNLQNEFFKKLYDKINSYDKILIVMIGYPASGKSFLRNELIKKYPKLKYLNNDDVTDKIINPNLIKSNDITNYEFIIDDNTNLNPKNREKIIKKYFAHKKIAIWFDYSKDICKHLNYLRMFWFGKKPINQLVYNKLAKDFVEPEVTEGFNYVIKVDHVFNDFNFDSKVKYYF